MKKEKLFALMTAEQEYMDRIEQKTFQIRIISAQIKGEESLAVVNEVFIEELIDLEDRYTEERSALRETADMLHKRIHDQRRGPNKEQVRIWMREFQATPRYEGNIDRQIRVMSL